MPASTFRRALPRGSYRAFLPLPWIVIETAPQDEPKPERPPRAMVPSAATARLDTPRPPRLRSAPRATERGRPEPRVTPAEFIAKWRPVALKERSAAQTHFNDLCRLLGLDDPVAADPNGDWFTFEKGASKATGGDGWADVWRKGAFGWEYKGTAQGPRRRPPPAPDVRGRAREPAAPRHLRHRPHRHPHQLHQHRPGGAHHPPRRPARRREARPPPRRLHRPRPPAPVEDPRRPHRRGRRAVLRPRPAAPRPRPRPPGRRPLRQPPGLLHVRRGREPAARDALPEDARRLPRRPGILRPERRPALRRDAERRPRRLHPRRLVQRRPLRRRHRPAARTRRHPRPDRGRPPRLEPDRPLDPRHPVRARPRPGQAQPARRPLHRPRQDHEDRQPGRRRAAARRMGRGEGRDRGRPRPREGRRSPPPPPPSPTRRRAPASRRSSNACAPSASSTRPAAPATSSTSACAR